MKYSLIVTIGLVLLLQVSSPVFAQRTHVPESSTVGTNLDSRAENFLEQGNFTKAESFYKKALALRERMLGPYHPLVAVSYENLAKLHQAQDQQEKAKLLYKRAQEIAEKASQPGPHDDWDSLNQATLELYHEGEYKRATVMVNKAITLAEQDSLNMVTSMENLSMIYEAQGKPGPAKAVSQNAQALKEKILNPDPPEKITVKPQAKPPVKPQPVVQRKTAPPPSVHPGLTARMDRVNQKVPGFDDVIAGKITVEEFTQGDDWKTLYMKFGELRIWGKVDLAIAVGKKAVEAAEKSGGLTDPNAYGLLSGLAALYKDQGKYAAAEPLYKREIEIMEKTYGPDHRSVGIGLRNLMAVYEAQGKKEQAKEIQPRLQAIEKKEAEASAALKAAYAKAAKPLTDAEYLAQVQQHTTELKQHTARLKAESLDTQQLTAGVSLYTGDYEEAEKLYKIVLEGKEKTLGYDHPDITKILKKLYAVAQGYTKEKQFAKAVALYQYLSDFYKDHGNTPLAFSMYAHLVPLQSKIDKKKSAEVLESEITAAKQALEAAEKKFGPDHAEVAIKLTALGKLHHKKKGKVWYKKVEPLYKRALEINEKNLGPDHLDVAINLIDLGRYYEDWHNPGSAALQYKRALEIREKKLGSDHLEVAVALAGLGRAYQEKKKYAEAEPFLMRAFEIRKKKLGPKHEEVAESLKALNSVGWGYKKAEQFAEAEVLFKFLLKYREKHYGSGSLNVTQSLVDLGNLYNTQAEYDRARPLYERAIDIYEKEKGPDDRKVSQYIEILAETYLEEKRYEKAEELYKRSLMIRVQVLEPKKSLVPHTLKKLRLLPAKYRLNKQPAQAEALEKYLQEFRNTYGDRYLYTKSSYKKSSSKKTIKK